MALLDEMRVRLRVVSDMTDSEIEGLVGAAFADMRRCGVRDELLDQDDPHPLVKHAIALYAKAYYGYDNSEREQFVRAYERTLCDLLNSRANEYLFSED